MPTYAEIRQNLIDPQILRLKEELYGSGVSYGRLSDSKLPPSTVVVGGSGGTTDPNTLGFIKGIAVYSGGTLIGSTKTELSFIGAGVTVAGVRATVDIATPLATKMPNPLTTSGDILYALTGGIPARLPIGSEGYKLTVSGGRPQWAQTVDIGFADPLTTNGDMLYRISGTTTRLPVGTNDQVLTVVSNTPVWQNIVLPSGGTPAPYDAQYIVTSGHNNLSNEIIIPTLAASPDIKGANGAVVSYEFDGGEPLFTWTGAAILSEDINTSIKSHYYIQTANTSSEAIGYYSVTPSGAFDVRMKVSVGGGDENNNGNVGLIIMDNTNATRILVLASQFGMFADKYTGGGYSQIGNTSLTAMGYHSTWYFRITCDINGFWTCGFSTDGILYRLVKTLVNDLVFTAARIGIRVAGDLETVAIDWLRIS